MTLLHHQCGESIDGALSIGLRNTVFFNSPRYMCSTSRRLRYRKNEFCLYNISIPDCPSGLVRIYPTNSEQRLQDRDDNGCTDYVQFFAGSYVSPRFCGNELSVGEGFELKVPSLQLLALFWTDGSDHKTGFQLVATCANNSTLHG